MIRFMATCIIVVSFLILSIPVLLVEWVIGKCKPDWKSKSSLAIVNWVFRICLLVSGVKVTVLGEENIPADTAVLYVGNHRSFYDILLTYVRVPRPTGYIAKKEMLKIPLLSHWMKNLHCLFLDRENLKEGMKTILSGIDKLKSGISIAVFPEGTRNKTEDTFLPFHEGSFKLAEKSKCPIIPISLNNSAAIFEDHLPKIKKANVVIEYGKPIYMDTLEKEEKKFIGAAVQKQIEAMYFKNSNL